MNRREMLKTVAGAALGPALGGVFGQERARGEGWTERVIAFLESCAKEDGGYGWEGQEHSHLSPTFYVIGSYRLLGKNPPRAKELAEFVRRHHPGALKKLEQERRLYEWQQVQALAWLGEDAGELKERILSWKEPRNYLKQYERHGYPLFSSEMGVILSRALMGVAKSELPRAFVEYLESRRRANGSFNNTPAADGADGNILSTWWGLRALATLGRAEERKAETVDWVRQCQVRSGGFTYAPKPVFGGVEDVAYTWAATSILRLLGSEPAEREGCVKWLHSLWKSDGGFADRPGWLSNPMATYYALGALEALGALRDSPARPRRSVRRPGLSSRLKVFSIQLEAHGRGSPAEAVDLARSLRIHLWGAKNAKPEWLARAQAIADEQKAGVKFFVSNEEYGTWVNVPGSGTYSHTSDIVAPAGAEIGESLAEAGVVSWEEFREQRWKPLESGRGRLIWQFGENEELVRMFLDDSVERGGFGAISTYHFGNPDFTNSEPFLHRWRGQIPFVALQDAHGPEAWWFAEMTTGFRTVFLAEEPTWEGWLEALKAQRVAAIRRDEWTKGKVWMHAPSREVREFVGEREREWRWWENEEIGRPMVSVVALRPEDEFEAGRPEKGVALRVRCAWRHTVHGLLKEPMSEFVSIRVDGKKAASEVVVKPGRNGLLEDHYEYVHPSEIEPGEHEALVVVRVRETGREVERRLKFRA